MRYRAKLVAIRSGLEAQVHAVLAKARIPVTAADLFGPSARRWLDNIPLETAFATRIGSLLELIDHLDSEEARFFRQIAE